MNEQHITEEQSLRTIELIPSGSIFVSRISNLADQPLNLPAGGLYQFGAWENLGFGWFRIEPINPEPRDERGESANIALTVESLDNQTVMMSKAYRAIDDFQGLEASRSKVKTVICQFGSRIKTQSIEAALAFELAKAKPFRKKYSHEVYAHRWLLYQLLNLESPPPTVDGEYYELHKDGEATWFANMLTTVKILNIEQRWQWLRRFSELGFD